MASPTDLIKTQIQMEGRRRLLGYEPRVEGAADALRFSSQCAAELDLALSTHLSQENCGPRWYIGAVEGLLAKCTGCCQYSLVVVVVDNCFVPLLILLIAESSPGESW